MRQKTLDRWEAAASMTCCRGSRRCVGSPGAPRGGDAECLTARVACRRVRSALALRGVPRQEGTQVEETHPSMTGVLGRVRDLDVQMEFVRGWIEARRSRRSAAVPQTPRQPGWPATEAQVVLDGASRSSSAAGAGSDRGSREPHPERLGGSAGGFRPSPRRPRGVLREVRASSGTRSS